jgi:hypothetical protein
MLANVYGAAVATDSIGNVYTVGYLQGWADLDPGTGQAWLGTQGEEDAFVAKYGADRSLKWVVRLSGSQMQTLNDVAVDADGSAYVVGKSVGDATFQDAMGSTQTISSALRATVVAKISTGGALQWVSVFAGAGTGGGVSYGGSIALDGIGHVYVGGSFLGGTVDFDPGPSQLLLTPQPYESGYVAKLHTTNGLFVSAGDTSPGWATPFVGDASIMLAEPWRDPTPVGLAADATGVYATGCFVNGTAHFGGDVPDFTDEHPDALNQNDGFLVKLDVDGVPRWGQHYIDTWPKGVAIDADSVYLAESGTYLTTGFVAQYDKASGSETWNKPWGVAMGGNNVGDVMGLQVQGANLYLIGRFSGTVDFDLGSGTFNLTSTAPSPSSDTFVWKMTDGGGFVWAGALHAGGYGIAVDGFGKVVTTGVFGSGGADFDPGTGTAALTSLGTVDAFVSRLAPDGSTLKYDTTFPAFQIGIYGRLVDDGDPGYVEAGSGWKSGGGGAGWKSNWRYHAKGKGANTATWSFSEVPAGAVYDVLATWVAKGSNASDAKYNVNGTIVQVNQRVAPSGGWYKLGAFPPNTQGKITVVLSDNANGNVVADAIQVVINGPAGSLALIAGPSGAAIVGPTSSPAASIPAGADTTLGMPAGDSLPVWPATGKPNGETPAKLRMASQADVFSGDDLLDELLGIPGQL